MSPPVRCLRFRAKMSGPEKLISLVISLERARGSFVSQ